MSCGRDGGERSAKMTLDHENRKLMRHALCFTHFPLLTHTNKDAVLFLLLHMSEIRPSFIKMARNSLQAGGFYAPTAICKLGWLTNLSIEGWPSICLKSGSMLYFVFPMFSKLFCNPETPSAVWPTSFVDGWPNNWGFLSVSSIYIVCWSFHFWITRFNHK